MSKNPIRKLLALLVFLRFLSTLSGAEDVAIVKEVIDGDTLRVEYNGTQEKVRLIGIDAPELKPNQRVGKQAASGQDVKTITLMGEKSTRFVKSW